MKKFWTMTMVFMIVNISSAFPDTLTNIFHRGLIGLKIKQITEAESCKRVSTQKMAQIKKLSLEFEEISTISHDAFQGLTALEQINLASNYIETIPANTFRGLVSLSQLDLSYNFISEISRSALGLSHKVRIKGVVVNP